MIELMISMAIVMILTGAMVQIVKYSETRNALNWEVNKVRSAIRLAQSYSLSLPNMTDRHICGFGAYVSDNDSFEVYYTYNDDFTSNPFGCDNVADHPPNVSENEISGVSLETINLENEVNFKDSELDDYVFFFAPYGEKSVASISSFVLEDSNDNEATININSEGKID